MEKALVIGGTSGIGLSVVLQLLKRGYSHVYIVGKTDVDLESFDEKDRLLFKNNTSVILADLASTDLSFLDSIKDINTLFYSAGFGRVTLFGGLNDLEIKNLYRVNVESFARIIKHYYDIIASDHDFYVAAMVSISGRIVSPFFSVYGSTKAGMRFLIENINCELSNCGVKNRLLDVSPGSLDGTSFGGKKTKLSLLNDLASSIVERMLRRDTLFIPNYDDVYKRVLTDYHNDPCKFGDSSFNYKRNSGRVCKKAQVVVGYLSGTFDLFHVGHLNLLRRAKEQCDYLIVSVHASGAWKGKETFIPYEERKAIVSSIKYVDKVVEDYREDCDAWEKYHYDKLFVGSDYKGTERFERYEQILKGKAEIIYFPYTKGTSSTQLRDALKKK